MSQLSRLFRALFFDKCGICCILFAQFQELFNFAQLTQFVFLKTLLNQYIRIMAPNNHVRKLIHVTLTHTHTKVTEENDGKMRSNKTFSSSSFFLQLHLFLFYFFCQRLKIKREKNNVYDRLIYHQMHGSTSAEIKFALRFCKIGCSIRSDT